MHKYTYPFVLVLFILVLAFSPLWVQAQTQKVRIVVDSAKLHLKPNPASQVISTVPLGAILELVLQKDDWYWVKLPPDQNGFVLSGYIHSRDTEVLDGKPTAQSQTALPVPLPKKQPVQTNSRPQYQPPAITKPQKTFQVKLMGGLGLANLSFLDFSLGGQDVLESAKQSQSEILGGIGLSFGKTFGIEVDALYMRKGAKFADETTIKGVLIEVDSNLNIDQLSIPILAKYKFTPGSSPFILAGGEVGLVISAKLAYSLTAGQISQSGEEDVKDDLRSIDYGLVFGAGYEAALGGLSVGLEGRYHLGLQNILDTSANPDSDEYIKTSVAVIAGFIKF